MADPISQLFGVLSSLAKRVRKLEVRAMGVGGTGGGGEPTPLPDHAHFDIEGDGGRFDLTNLLSSGAALGQVPVADGAGNIYWGAGGNTVSEGPGIDLVAVADDRQVGLGGDTVLLYQSNGDPVAEYAPTDTGLTAAGAAVISASDRIEIPGNAVIQAEHTLAGCEYRFPAGLIVGGTLTLSANTRAWNLQSIVSGNSEDAVIGVLGPGDGEAHLFNCRIAPVNSGAGGVHAVHVGSSGNLVCHSCYLDGTNGGYAGYRDPECAGTLRIEGGAALGSSADDPFNE